MMFPSTNMQETEGLLSGEVELTSRGLLLPGEPTVKPFSGQVLSTHRASSVLLSASFIIFTGSKESSSI
jgi:hypothetical protein